MPENHRRLKNLKLKWSNFSSCLESGHHFNFLLIQIRTKKGMYSRLPSAVVLEIRQLLLGSKSLAVTQNTLTLRTVQNETPGSQHKL